MSLKIAYDSGPVGSEHKVRGIGVVVREQLDALKRIGKGKIRVDSFDFGSDAGAKKLSVGDYDIAHFQDFFPFRVTLPDKKYARCQIVTIHDLIQLVYPSKYPPGVKGRINFWKQKSRLKNYIDGVITVSETSKKDIVRFLGLPEDKVFVVKNGNSSIYKKISDKRKLGKISKKYKLPKKFIFYLGDVNYNKNIPTLIEACDRLKLPLVIAGKHAAEIEEKGLLSLMDISGPQDYVRFLFDIPHPENAHYALLLDKFKDKEKIIRLGYVPDSEIAEVMNLASVYVQPSYYEGFGMPVLHAFSCEVPVVIAKTNALVEVVDGAALVTDPHSARDMAKKIEKILKDEKTKEQLIQKGKERAKQFSWEKNAKELIEVYEKVFGA